MSELITFLDRLHGRVFKILPQKEEGNPNLSKYLETLAIELAGARRLFPELQKSGEYVDIIATVYGLAERELPVSDVRREMFKLQNLITRIERAVGGDSIVH